MNNKPKTSEDLLQELGTGKMTFTEFANEVGLKLIREDVIYPRENAPPAKFLKFVNGELVEDEDEQARNILDGKKNT